MANGRPYFVGKKRTGVTGSEGCRVIAKAEGDYALIQTMLLGERVFCNHRGSGRRLRQGFHLRQGYGGQAGAPKAT
jgi:hypothetical protein